MSDNTRYVPRLFLTLAAALWASAPAGAGQPATADTAPRATSQRASSPVAGVRGSQYYVVIMDGRKIGHAVHTRDVAEDRVITTEAMELTMGRGEMTITIRQSETNIETAAGRPLGFESVQGIGAVEQRVSGAVEDGRLTVTQSGAGPARTVTSDYPAGALMSEGARLLQARKGLAEGTSYSMTVFLPSMQDSMTAHVTVGPPRRIDLLGRVVTLPEVVTAIQMSTGRIVATSYVDEHMTAQKTVVPMMGMMLEMVACEKSVAMSDNDPLDLLERTLLASPVAIPAQTARSAAYLLEPTGDGKLGGVIATDSQVVQPAGDGGLLVTVTPASAPSGAEFPYAGDDPAALAALKPNRFVNSDDPRIVALARRAIGDTADAAQAARRIEAFVKDYITEKNLSVGYASASEVAESREGDCSEHAVLAAAMCRAVGIPARVTAGYVYMPSLAGRSDVFAGHAWVEAFIGGRWVGLDATRGYVGVGHIAQAAGDGDPAGFFQALSTMGWFRIAEVTVRE